VIAGVLDLDDLETEEAIDAEIWEPRYPTWPGSGTAPIRWSRTWHPGRSR